jgi:glycine/D-amino acid oxidase-like deaminating enzyme
MGRVVIIGAGIAGLSTAAALARRGREVVVVEREALVGAGSTGRNAAIFRLAVAEPENVELAQAAKRLGARLVPGGAVAETGAYYVCTDARERDAILRAAATAGVHEVARSAAPALLQHARGPILCSPRDGVIDVHALVQALSHEASAHGARLRFGTQVERIDRAAGRAVGVILSGGAGGAAGAGERLAAETIVDATGAWSPTLAGASDSDVGIRPFRRHLFVLDLAPGHDGASTAPLVPTIVWSLADGYYLRPESGGVLASACDETALAAGDLVPTDPEVAAILFEKLAAVSPALAEARVRRAWAGLRPLTADHRFVVGPDPRIAGLFRVGGFGGHGMTAGAAAGEIAAALLCGELPAMAPALDPGRAGLVG